MKHLLSTLTLFLCVLGINAQELNLLPKLTPVGGTYDDNVTVKCTFPEGCAGGKYWFDGGQIAAQTYQGPIKIETTKRLSVAGVNAEGRIITDVLTQDYVIRKVTPPYVTTSPAVNSSRESFYVTTIQWNNAVSTALDLTDFKDGGSRAGQRAVWLVYEPTQQVIATNTYSGLWLNGTDTYKAYLYKNYRPEAEGAYTLHIASGVFVIDGKPYNEELVLKYFVGQEEITAPVFSPVSGTYEDKVQVSITYPQNAFYQFYQIEGKNRQIYDGPFTITESCSITAWGKSEDYAEDTESSTANYTVIPTTVELEELPTPVFSREGNTIRITDSEPNVIIKYWFDNHMQNAQIYNGAFEVEKNCRISAVAYREGGISQTANYTVSHFPTDEGDLGLKTFQTPDGWESVHLTGMSPNGRFACGYTDGTGATPMAFLWDLTSGKAQYVSTAYYCRATGVSNDGTIIGWRMEVDPVTGESTSTSDETLFYGYCKNGEWTRQPRSLTVMGITGDNILYGSSSGKPATYNTTTKELTIFSEQKGSLNCVSADGNIFGGQIIVDGKVTPAYWVGDAEPVTINAERECGVVRISGNGRWMLLDNQAWGSYCDIAGYRYDAVQKSMETLVSMGARYPSRYEWMYSITNDGTLFGVYDRSMLSHEVGKALAYTTDGVWMDVADVLADRDFVADDLSMVACKLVSPDQNTFVMTVYPMYANPDDAFASALAVRFDAVLSHAAPISVKAVQMFGMKNVKVSWEAPLDGAEDVAAYKILRNGSVIGTVDAITFSYYDVDVENQSEYAYTIVAVYNDGVESEPSFPYTLTIVVEEHSAVRQLAVRQSGINDINLSWQSPIISLPKLQYFDEESEFAAFGTSGYDSEWGIRIPASDLNAYEGLDIRTFQFLPTGAQEAYEIRLYTGTKDSWEYNTTPFYTQSIDPASLKYGTVNSIVLTTPQSLPVDEDLIVAIYINQKGNDNMLGVSHEGFKAGYTDLCRVIGVHEEFISISEESHVATEIVVPIGVGIASAEMLGSSTVESYEVSDNGVVLGNVDAIRYRIESVDEGEHCFAVRALYQDGEYSEPTSIVIDVKKNEAAFVPVSDVKVDLNEEGKAEFSWKAPLNDDKTLIHWGDLNPTEGLKYEGYPIFSVGAIYPVTLTNSYADEYEITHLFFYPTAEAWFRLYLDDNIETVLYDETIEEVEVNKMNYIALPNPITIDASTNYRFVIDIDNCLKGEAPLAFDSSNQSADGYSNNLNAGNDWMTLNDVLQIDEHPNWLMGLVIRQKNAKEMPLQGYNVVVDGVQKNDQLITECTFATEDLTSGEHEATVDVVYDEQRNVKSKPVCFQFVATGIETVEVKTSTTVAGDDAGAVVFDLQGRRVIKDKMGRGLFIVNSKKVVK